jgi:hypothetical protein
MIWKKGGLAADTSRSIAGLPVWQTMLKPNKRN